MKVTNAQLRKAYINFYEFHHRLDCEELENRFSNYLHSLEDSHHEDDDLCWWDNEDTEYYVLPATRDKIIQAAGPYSNAIFKIWYATYDFTKRY